MLNLPFEITFDLNFSNKIPKKELLSKLQFLFSNITPKPIINLTFKEADENLYNFITHLITNFKVDITAFEPILNDNFLNLAKNQIINIKVFDDSYDLSKVSNYNYNLILPFKNNLYEYLKSINNANINKIVLQHCNSEISYDDFKNQLELIKKDKKIKEKSFLLPYLEEHEQKNYYSKNGKIRSFLTCAALWLNPVINSDGKIALPCYCSNKSTLENDFFDLWNCDELNALREKLINCKQLSKCSYCEKFYQENFLVVEDGILEYKNKTFLFDNILNPVKSAPSVGIISKDNICYPIAFYSDEEIIKEHKNLVMLIK